MSQRLLITGAAGQIGSFLRPRLARPGRILRLLDLAPPPAAAPGEAVEIVHADITDPAAMREACRGVDAVIHLAAISHEAGWPEILHTNIDGTYGVLEGARHAGVPRVILASSNHAVGFHPLSGGVIPDYLLPRPDTFYGVSKAANEALGSLYHDRYRMDVLCVRIGSCTVRPHDRRSLGIWLSPDDCARLMEALLTTPHPGFRIVWGQSANTRGQFSLDEAQALGYRPHDNAEQYAEAVLTAETNQEPRYVGGTYTD